MTRKTYIGDSVYAEIDDDEIVLTTNNSYPDDPRNRIVLDSEGWKTLKDFVEPSTQACGIVPPTAGYRPCRRSLGHSGPCAHEFVDDLPVPVAIDPVAYQKWADANACKSCGARPDKLGTVQHGRGCFAVSKLGGGVSFVAVE